MKVIEMTPEYYEFIPVDDTRRRAIPKDKFTPRDYIKHIHTFNLQFITESPLCIGSGEKGYREKVILKHLKNAYGEMVVPGSSLKGMISTNFLTLSGSDSLTSNLFGTSQTGRGRFQGPAISRIFFSDAIPNDSIAPQMAKIQESWPPRSRKSRHVKIYTSQAPDTSEYGVAECIPKGTALSTRIVGNSLNEIELGGILMSLGLVPNRDTPSGILRMGYGKPQGLGMIRINPQESQISTASLKDGIPHAERDESFLNKETIQCMNKFLNMGMNKGRDINEHWKTIFNR